MINTVKYVAKILEPGVNTSYLVNGDTQVPFSDSPNSFAEKIRRWEAEGNIIEEAFTPEEIDAYLNREKYNNLELVFNEKVLGLKKLAIDKDWMVSEEAINNQYKVYEEIYTNAKSGLYTTIENDAIILANETTKSLLSDVTLLLNNVRSIIEKEIVLGNDIEGLLTSAREIKLSKKDLTNTKLNKIKKTFGIV